MTVMISGLFLGWLIGNIQPIFNYRKVFKNGYELGILQSKLALKQLHEVSDPDGLKAYVTMRVNYPPESKWKS